MKNFIIQLFSLIILGTALLGCDVPQRTRLPLSSSSSDSESATTTDPNAISYESGTLGDSSTSGSTSTGTTQTDSDFPSCDLSYKYSTVDIGSFGLCQSSVTETSFKVKFGTATSTRNCLIPLYKDSTGSSTYIGQPQCTSVTQSGEQLQGTLYKNRSGFESYPLNGVIVMKEALLPEYFNCMHGYLNWIAQACPSGINSSPYCYYWVPRCPYGAKTNSTCDQAARSYMSEICTTFKSRYGNSYVDIRTK
jgi:hypothetical protein